jgi:hypothetical protein
MRRNNAATKGGTNTGVVNPDPVVKLSEQLLALWNADDTSQIQHNDVDSPSQRINGIEIQQQLSDWQRAVATIISFTPATSPAGAVVQMALALDELDSMLGIVVCGDGERPVRKLPKVDEYRIERLIRSALRAVRKSVGPEFESVRGIVDIYASYNDENWLDDVPKWAEQGRVARQSGGD